MMGSDQKDIFAGEGARMVQGAIEGTSSTLFVYGEHSHGWLCPTHPRPERFLGFGVKAHLFQALPHLSESFFLEP
jgi:hypothetical protein